jgi:hypothetical protein
VPGVVVPVQVCDVEAELEVEVPESTCVCVGSVVPTLVVVTLVVGADSDATPVTVNEVVSLWVEDVPCEEVLVPEEGPIVTLVVLVVGGGEVVVECWEDACVPVVTRSELLAGVELDGGPAGNVLDVLFELEDPPKYAPTTRSNRTITMPAENMT